MLSPPPPAGNIWSIFLFVSSKSWHREGCCVDASGMSYPKSGSDVWWTLNYLAILSSSLLKSSSVVCHRLGWLKPQTLISHHFQAQRVQEQGAGTLSSWRGPSSCLAGRFLLLWTQVALPYFRSMQKEELSWVPSYKSIDSIAKALPSWLVTFQRSVLMPSRCELDFNMWTGDGA